MAEVDIDTIVDQLTLIGLISRDQYREARDEASDGSGEALIRVLLRKEWLTSWQVEHLKKNDVANLFFGNYTARFHIAEGTFARVYRGVHNDTREPVAIKVLRGRFSSIPEAVLRFHKEAEAGMRLQHPNIVRLIDEGHQDAKHFMVMEYVEGMNLREFLRHRTRLKGQDAAPLMLGLARGMQYSHEQGVTHRDIKATNILISNTGTAKLVDFGLATINDEEKTGLNSQRTVDYSALERTCKSPKGDPRSDIYFLGCVFYNMVTGQVPLEDSESKDPLKKRLKRSFGIIKPIAEHSHAPDKELCRIIDRMMKLELKDRYQTLDAVVSDLETYLGIAKPRTAGAFEEDEERDALDFDSIFVRREEPATAGARPSKPDDDLAGEHEEGSLEADRIEIKANSQKNLLCVETQPEIQDVMRKQLARMGYRVLLVGDAERAAERYREQHVDAVIFDADGLGSGAIDSFVDMHDKAHEDGHPLVALVLLGPRQGALKERLPEDDRLIVLSKPIKFKQVQDAIHQLLPVA